MNIRSISEVNKLIDKINRPWIMSRPPGTIQASDSGVIFDFGTGGRSSWFPPIAKLDSNARNLWVNVPKAREIVSRLNSLTRISFLQFRGGVIVSGINAIFTAGEFSAACPPLLPMPKLFSLRKQSSVRDIQTYANRSLQAGLGVSIAESEQLVKFEFDAAFIIPDGGGGGDWTITIVYSWSPPEEDLDTTTNFLGELVGFGNLDPKTYIVIDDDEQDFGPETVTIYAGQALTDGAWSMSTVINCAADWYPPAGGSGPASFRVYDNRGHDFSKSISPGSTSTPADTPVATVTIGSDFSLVLA